MKRLFFVLILGALILVTGCTEKNPISSTPAVNTQPLLPYEEGSDTWIIHIYKYQMGFKMVAGYTFTSPLTQVDMGEKIYISQPYFEASETVSVKVTLTNCMNISNTGIISLIVGGCNEEVPFILRPISYENEFSFELPADKIGIGKHSFSFSILENPNWQAYAFTGRVSIGKKYSITDGSVISFQEKKLTIKEILETGEII